MSSDDVLASEGVGRLAQAWGLSRPDLSRPDAAWTACRLVWRRISIERSGTTELEVRRHAW